jgi:competence protein ComEA
VAYFKLAKIAVLTVSLAFVTGINAQTKAIDQDKALTSSAVTKLNVNSASVEQLIKIKGLGPKKAKAIIQYIQQNGALVSLDELLEIRGIGQKLLGKLKTQLSL